MKLLNKLFRPVLLIKRNYLKLFLLVLSSVFLSGSFQSCTFQKTYDGDGIEIGYSVAHNEDTYSNFVLGKTNSYGAGGYDYYFIRTTIHGDTSLIKTYGGSNNDIGKSIKLSSDTTCILAGYTNSFGAGNNDFYVISIDTLGTVLWSKTYGGAGEDSCLSVYYTTNDSLVLAGTTTSYGAGGLDVYLVKTNNSGDTLWTRTYGGTSTDVAESVCQTSDGGFIIAGYTESFGAGENDVYLIKTKINGDTLWTKTYGGTNDDYGRSVCQASDGGFFITGETKSFGAGDVDVYLIKTDSDGEVEWAKAYGGNNDDFAWSVIPNNSGDSVIIAGATFSYGAGNSDIYLIKADYSGDTIWTKTYGSAENEESFEVKETLNNNDLLLIGYTDGFETENRAVYLIKTDSCGESGCYLSGTNTTISTTTTSVDFGAEVGFGGIVNTPSTIDNSPISRDSTLCYECQGFPTIAYFESSDSNLTVTFTNFSSNDDLILWEFGDGKFDTLSTDTLPNPIHTYDNPGTYQVCVTVIDLCLKPVYYCESVTVSDAGGYTPFELDSLALVALYNNTDGANWFMNTNWLTGNLSTWYGITVSDNRVTHINLGDNNINGTLPQKIGDLTGLTDLRLYGNLLSGSIPSDIGDLTSLTYLALYDNQFSGSLPSDLGNLVNLTIFYLQQNELSGTIPSELGNLVNLTYLELEENQLTGSIPSELGLLVNLVTLSLYTNQLSGSIPAEICNLVNLTYLDLHDNQLTGSIPANINNLVNMEQLALNDNWLSGSIPSEIGNMANLKYLYLNKNALSGSIPIELGTMVILYHLGLEDNQLSGTIPVEIGGIDSLMSLTLNNNVLTGTIPEALGDLLNLTVLQLNENNFTGAIPAAITNITKLWRLFIYNNNLDDLPDLSSLTDLSGGLWIYNNLFTFEDIEPNIGVSSSFSYSPQDSIGTEWDTTLAEGENLIISVSVSGDNNLYQWKKDQVNIGTSSSDSTYTITSAGSSDDGIYTCEITNTVATDLTLYSRKIHVNVDVTGVEPDILNDEDINIYPNPNKGEFTVDLSTVQNGPVTISIYNALGNLMLNRSYNTTKNKFHHVFELDHFAKGIYYLQIISGDQIFTRKIIIE